MKVSETVKIRVPTAPPTAKHTGKKGAKGYDRKNNSWKKECD